MNLNKQTIKNHIPYDFLLFICKKKSIQCNHLAYFLNVLPNAIQIRASLLIVEALLSTVSKASLTLRYSYKKTHEQYIYPRWRYGLACLAL